MSDEDSSQQGYKKRRIQNACDECRRKKRKCDSAIRAGNVCSNCINFKTQCTHDFAMAKKKRGPPIGQPRGQRSIRATVDAILSVRSPFEVPKDPVKVKQILADLANHIMDLEGDIAQLRLIIQESSSTNDSALTSGNATTTATVDEDALIHTSPTVYNGPSPHFPSYSVDDLTEQLNMFEFDVNPQNIRYFGSSSSRSLVAAVMDAKKEFTGNNHILDDIKDNKRPEFWTIHPWQKNSFNSIPLAFEFPPDDLLADLVDLYFTHFNSVLCFVFRPSFLKSLAEGLHHKDRHFGALVLAVCALGARFSNDPRNLEDSMPFEQSIGWKWIRQIQPLKQSYIDPPTIHEIEMYAVYCVFMSSTTTLEIVWILISVATRFVQDVGAHRKQRADSKPSVKTESWKRAFWVVYGLDIFASTFLGRPRSMFQDDFDTELPLEVDDEYWEPDDPEMAFKQPPGKPSTMCYWICFLKLMHILGSVLRNLYPLRQTDMWSAMRLSKLEWSEKIVAELDSSLNKWADELPEHLKWDPNRENTEHFRQSVMLYTTYYWVQILVHRPFIPRPEEDLILSFPSLAICANAARSCLHVIDVQQQRNAGLIMMPNVMMSCFNCVIVLLLNNWRGRRCNGSSMMALQKELADVRRSIDILHSQERRWETAGRFADILMEVISVSHFHRDLSQPRPSLKRARNPESNSSPLEFASKSDGGEEPQGQRQIAKNNRVSAAFGLGEASRNAALLEPASPSNLPLHSSELGRLPLYEHLDWGTDQNQPLMNTDGWSPAYTNDPTTNTESDWRSLFDPAPPGFGDLSELPPGSSAPGEFNVVQAANVRDNSMLTNSDDWTSYMASIDEVLQSMNPHEEFVHAKAPIV